MKHISSSSVYELETVQTALQIELGFKENATEMYKREEAQILNLDRPGSDSQLRHLPHE